MSDFGIIAEGSRKQLYAFVCSFISDGAVAEDIVQESLIVLWETLSKGVKVKYPVAFLMKVARNRALDVLRSSSYRSERIESAVCMESGSGMYDEIDGRDRVAQVRKIVRGLPEQQRSVFILRDIMEYDMGDIALILDIREANVRQLLSRARRKIREYLLNNE